MFVISARWFVWGLFLQLKKSVKNSVFMYMERIIHVLIAWFLVKDYK
jgi:hypothetical protein